MKWSVLSIVNWDSSDLINRRELKAPSLKTLTDGHKPIGREFEWDYIGGILMNNLVQFVMFIIIMFTPLTLMEITVLKIKDSKRRARYEK